MARCVRVYNKFAAQVGTPQLTVLRTPLVSGGMFMLKDVDENPLIDLNDHAGHYMQGVFEEIARPLFLTDLVAEDDRPTSIAADAGSASEHLHNSGVRRIEFMTPEPKAPHAFREGYKQFHQRAVRSLAVKSC